MGAERVQSGSGIVPERAGSVGLSRYDAVLALIPLAFLAGGVAGATTFPWVLALAAGGVVACSATAYGLFVDPPSVDGDGESGGESVVGGEATRFETQ